MIPREAIGGALAVLLTCAPTLRAQGLSVYTHSACALARAGTGVADPCADGSAVFYGPAGLAFGPSVASIGIMALATESEFTFDGPGPTFETEQGTTWAPHLWLAVRPTRRLGAGIGLWAPYGLVTEWPLAFEGRFDGYDNELRAIYIQPTLAYQVLAGRIALGAGLVITRTTVDLRRRIDLATTPIPGTEMPFAALGVPLGTDFADLLIDIDAWAATFHLGLEVRASDRWSFGARYLHTADLDLDGRAGFRQVATGLLLPPGNPLGLPAGTPLDPVLALQFAPGGPLSNQDVATELTLPNQFVIGTRFRATPAFRILLDYQWTGWDHFDEAALDFARAPADTLFLDFENTSTVRLGADITPNDRLALRTGILYNDAATPDVTVTPLLPEGQRITLTGGLGYRFSSRFTADAGLEVIFQEERRGRVRPRESRRQTAADLNVGVYEGNALVIGLTLSYRFGPTR
ncbi:MAG TPA: outer membrane protein transport protein [Longimicrobiales bacterium]